MAFCTNCGAKLQNDAKFCAQCGFAVTYAEHSKRKMIYEGELHKCPNCGELLNSFVSSCPACGYELRNPSAGRAIIEFATKLESVETNEKRARLITNFAIPNSKEDILEFIILASTNADFDYDTQEIVNAWLVKLEQCYHKANLILYKDPEFPQIQNMYDKTYKKIKRKKKKIQNRKIKSIKTIDTSNSKNSIFSGVLQAIPKAFGVLGSTILFLVSIKIDQTGGNASGFELLGSIFLIVCACMSGRKNTGYLEILFCAIGGGLSIVLANQLDNGSLLQLTGFVVLVIVTINYFRKLIKKE